MTRFKTKEEFQKFLDNENFCLCGKLLTGLHESNCVKIRKEWDRLNKRKDLEKSK